jgi:hypothetical protein
MPSENPEIPKTLASYLTEWIMESYSSARLATVVLAVGTTLFIFGTIMRSVGSLLARCRNHVRVIPW